MKAPIIYTIQTLIPVLKTFVLLNNNWTPERLVTHNCTLSHRIKCAYLAFTGKCDLIKWPEDQ